MTISPTWPEDRIEALKQLWAEGLSSTSIAARLGAGITRNAVIGKATRIGLPRRGPSSRRHQPRRTVARPRPATPPPTAPLPMPVVADIARVSVLDAERHHCRWPVGDPVEIGANRPLYCGLARVPGLPYCPDHVARAYEPPAIPSRAKNKSTTMETTA